MDRCFTFVIESMLIFPTNYPSYIRTRLHLSPIKNQSEQFTSRKKEFWHICNSSKENCKQTDAHFYQLVVWNKMIQVCNRFCLFLYSRLPPQQYMTWVWPIKGGLYCWGPPFNLKKYWCTWKNCWVIITFIFIYKYTCYFLTFSNTD